MSQQLHQRSAEELAEGYDWAHRRWEILGITVFFVCEAVLLWRTVGASPGNGWAIAAAAIAGYVAADFLSGFVHWLGDSWGSTEMPVLGRNFIRPFRHHHVDQLAITRHDFVATNGNNCICTLFALVPAVLVPVDASQPWRLFALAFVMFLTLGVFATNQFHKWAHMPEPPRFVQVLQRLWLILPPEHHRVHHTAPYERYFCITAGWLNPILEKVAFFPIVERVVTRVTGILPRQDDIGEEAALAVAQAYGVVGEPGRDPAEGPRPATDQ